MNSRQYLYSSLNRIRFIVPEYCQFYKPLLVEEFSLNTSPLLLHYGLCAVIGRTIRDPDSQRTYLGSIRLVGLSRKFQCPDGSSRVALHTTSYGKFIPANTTVIVFGESTLYDRSAPEDSVENEVLTTSKELMLTIGKMQTDLEMNLGLRPRPPSGLTDASMHTSVRSALNQEVNAMNKRFDPAITVHSFNIVDDPHSLISANLRLDLIRKSRDAKQLRRNEIYY